MVRVNDACQPKKAVHVLLDLHQHTELDVVFGPSCADSKYRTCYYYAGSHFGGCYCMDIATTKMTRDQSLITGGGGATKTLCTPPPSRQGKAFCVSMASVWLKL